MALELMPDGTFKKLTKVQTDALDRYYKREKGDEILPALIQSPIFPTLVFGSISAITIGVVWAYLNEKDFDLGQFLGGGVAAIYSDDPKSPNTITLADGTTRELTRCQQWEQDAIMWKIAEQGVFGQLNAVLPAFMTGGLKIAQATKALNIITNMKKEGCPKPTAFSDAQWAQG